MSSSTVDNMLETLERQGHRITDQRKLILKTVVAHKGHFTARDVLADVQERAPDIGRATVFRTLELLERLGFLSRVHESDGCHGYVICDKTHHHHLVCSGCGLVVNVLDCDLAEQTLKLCQATKFRVDGHRLEFFGLCGSCQTSPM